MGLSVVIKNVLLTSYKNLYIIQYNFDLYLFSLLQVMEASSVRNESWKNHQEAAAVFEEAQKNVQQLYKGLFKNITKSR